MLTEKKGEIWISREKCDVAMVEINQDKPEKVTHLDFSNTKVQLKCLILAYLESPLKTL